MLLYEYDEQFHIASEKEISWEEGREEGIKEGKEEGRKEGIKEGIKEERKGGINILISACRKMGLNEEGICQMLMDEYGLTEKEAKKFLGNTMNL